MKKYLALILVLVSCTGSNLLADNTVANFFRWLLNKPESSQEITADTRQEKDDELKDVAGEDEIVLEDDEAEPEDFSQEYAVRRRTVSDEEVEWAVTKLWEANVSSEEQEKFLETLELVSEQESGAQKIFQPKKSSTIHNQYTRVIREWHAHKDAEFAQRVTDLLNDIYLRTFLA